MRFLALQNLFPRQVPFRYVSPAICEGEFSATGTTAITLSEIFRANAPSGLILGGLTGFRLSWTTYPGAICYSVYRLVDELDPFSEYVVIAECITDNFIDINPAFPGTHRITAITPNGETPLSNPVYVPPPVVPPPDCVETGDPVPASFLVDLDVPDNTDTGVGTPGSSYTTNLAGGAAPAGAYRVRFNGGIQITDLDGGFGSFFGFRHEIPGGGLVHGLDSIAFAGASCTTNSPPGVPNPGCPASTLSYESANNGTYVDGLIVLPTQAPAVIVFTAPGVTDVPPGFSSGSTSYTAERYAEFLPMPETAAILDFATKIALIVPEDSLGAPGAPVWDGVVDETFYMDASTVQITMPTSKYVGNVACRAYFIGTAGVGWVLTIQADWTDGGGPQTATIWQGEKAYGATPSGDYVKTSALREDAPTCLTCSAPA